MNQPNSSRTGKPGTIGDFLVRNVRQMATTNLEKKRKQAYDKLNSTYRWVMQGTDLERKIFTGYSKFADTDEFKGKSAEYNEVDLLMDKITMLQRNDWVFNKANRIDFWFQYFSSEDGEFGKLHEEVFLTITPSTFWLWQPEMIDAPKWQPLHAWLNQLYFNGYIQKAVTRESFLSGGGKGEYIERYKSNPLTRSHTEKLDEISVDKLLNPEELPHYFRTESLTFEKVGRFLNYLIYTRKAAVGQVYSYLSRLKEFYPQLQFDVLKPNQYFR